MTVDIPTRAPEQAPDGGGRRGLKGGPQITIGRPARSAPLVVGAQPRANLLPPEIILKRKQLKTRRALRFGVVLVAIATAAACVATFGVSTAAQVQLQAVQAQQNALVLEQAGYQEVRDVLLTIDTIKAGSEVGASTEVNWRDFVGDIQASLPSGVSLVTVKAEAATPMTVFPQSDAPLQGVRVGEIAFSASSKTLPIIPDWLRALEKLPGFVDAIPGSVKKESDGYTAEIVMHFNEEAFSLRYDPVHMAEVAAAAEAAAKSDGTIKSMVAKPAADDTEADGAADDSATDEEVE